MVVATSTPMWATPAGSSVRGGDHPNSRSERVQKQDVRPGDARMEDVAADGDDQTADSFQGAADW